MAALEDGIKQRQWWNESIWKMDKTGSDVRVFKPKWYSEDKGVYLWLRPWIEQPKLDLSVYGKPATFSANFAPIFKKHIEGKYPGKMAGDFTKRLTGVNTFLERTLSFSFAEKNQVEKILERLDEMVSQFENILDASVDQFNKK